MRLPIQIYHIYYLINPLISTNPQNSSTSSQVNLSWTPPTQTRSAFNFIDGGLATMNNTYSFLPYINDIWIQYSTTASYPSMGNSAIINVANGAFKYSQITANNQRLTNVNKLRIVNTGTGSPTATLLGAPNTDTIQLDLTTGAIGGTYSYKIAYVNNSEDISWNYLTFGGQSFGNPGPANPPLSLSFTNITYSSLTVGGLGAVPPPPPPTGTGMDASLNLPYGTPNFFVGYGVDISGVKRTGAIQVGGNTTDVPVTDISVGNLTSTLQTQTWSKNIDSSAAFPEYIIKTINTPSQPYFAVNSSEDYYNFRVPNVTNASAVAYIPIPTRSEAVTGTDYTTAITSSTNFALGSLTGDSISIPIARKRSDVSMQFSNVEFLSDLSSIRYNSSNFYKLIANFGDADIVAVSTDYMGYSGSYLGSDASGIPLTQFKVDISNGTGSSASSGPSLSSSLISGVWTQGSNTECFK